MRVLAVVGRGARGVADRIAGRLEAEAPVARVTCEERADGGQVVETNADATTHYRLGPTGWTASGSDLTLEELLDDLARDHAHAILSGRSDVTVPTVSIAGATAAGPIVYETTDPDSVDLDAVIDMISELDQHETLHSLIERVTRDPSEDRAGAIATFTGRVRAKDDPDDVRTLHLEYDSHEELAEERMATIERELAARDGVHAVALHHRTGVVEAGEASVFVVILAGHRAEAFAAVQDGIDRLKAEVPIFKKEVTVEGEIWAHDRP